MAILTIHMRPGGSFLEAGEAYRYRGVKRSHYMRLFVRTVQLAVISLFLSNCIFGATVKTKGGKSISGEIQGLVVLKGEELESGRGGRSIAYVIAQGKDIASIDEKGLNTVPEAIVRVVVCSYSAADGPDEAFCLGLAKDWFPMVAAVNQRADASSSKMDVTMRGMNAKNLTQTLIGELTTEGDKDVVLPALTITTAAGSIKLPVEGVVKPIRPPSQKEKGKEPAP
jgi:hypothetical protein